MLTTEGSYLTEIGLTVPSWVFTIETTCFLTPSTSKTATYFLTTGLTCSTFTSTGNWLTKVESLSWMTVITFWNCESVLITWGINTWGIWVVGFSQIAIWGFYSSTTGKAPVSPDGKVSSNYSTGIIPIYPSGKRTAGSGTGWILITSPWLLVLSKIATVWTTYPVVGFCITRVTYWTFS